MPGLMCVARFRCAAGNTNSRRRACRRKARPWSPRRTEKRNEILYEASCAIEIDDEFRGRRTAKPPAMLLDKHGYSIRYFATDSLTSTFFLNKGIQLNFAGIRIVLFRIVPLVQFCVHILLSITSVEYRLLIFLQGNLTQVCPYSSVSTCPPLYSSLYSVSGSISFSFIFDPYFITSSKRDSRLAKDIYCSYAKTTNLLAT